MVQGEATVEDINDVYASKDFKDAQMLFISEVKHILDVNLAERKEKEGAQYEYGPVVEKAFSYATRFSTFINNQEPAEFRRKLKDEADYEGMFKEHEITLLGNLCPDNVDEATHLIPSINNHLGEVEGRERMDRALAEIQKHCRQ